MTQSGHDLADICQASGMSAFDPKRLFRKREPIGPVGGKRTSGY